MMTQSADVIVLGGGIVGASTAHALAKQGKKVMLIEQFEPGHDKGSSHGDGRVVRFNYTEAIYVEMAMLAYKAWDTLSAEAGETLIRETGLLEYGPKDNEAIKLSTDILKTYEIPFETLSPDEATKRFPQYSFQADSQIIYQPGGAVAMATPAVMALWRLFKEKGGIAITGKRIESIDVQSDSVTLTSNDGEIFHAENLVLTAGGWTKKLAAQLNLDLPLDVTQEILAYFPPKDESVNHHVGTMPVMIEYYGIPGGDAAAHFYCLPMVDVPGVKLGWHHSGILMEADDDRVISDEIVNGLRYWARHQFPHLNDEAIELVTCLYTNTPDYHFILDKHPDYDNVTIGAGFSGHGFKFAPLLGELLAGLVTGQDAPVTLDTFKIARFATPDSLDKRVGA